MSSPTLIEKQVHLLGSENQKSQGTASIQSWNTAEVKKRALKGWLLCWGLALLSVFLPIAHFILVPLFIILGPILFFFLKNTTSKILELKGPCPHCQKSFELKNQADKWPIHGMCESCRKTFVIES